MRQNEREKFDDRKYGKKLFIQNQKLMMQLPMDGWMNGWMNHRKEKQKKNH